MLKRITMSLAVTALLATTMIPAGYAGNGLATGRPDGTLNIYVLAKQAGLNTLAAAVKAAGLQGTLAAKGPFTVFAPTDAAFAALGEETLNAVLADKELLTNILLYHVAEGEKYATDVLSMSTIEMLNGEMVTVNAGDVTVNGAGIAQTDIPARNGVVHVINEVLLPPSMASATSAKTLRGPQLSGSTAESTTWGEIKGRYND